jgi:hypothetical protein
VSGQREIVSANVHGSIEQHCKRCIHPCRGQKAAQTQSQSAHCRLWFFAFPCCPCRHTNQTGVPIMRPLWYEFPEKEELFGVDDEFMLGPGMLIKPVTHVRLCGRGGNTVSCLHNILSELLERPRGLGSGFSWDICPEGPVTNQFFRRGTLTPCILTNFSKLPPAPPDLLFTEV